METLRSRVIIGNYEFKAVKSVTIDSSWGNLVDKAVITTSQKLTFEGTALSELIKVGDKVEIYLNYDPFETKRFEGYVSNIVVDNPMTIECEDGAWLMKQFNLDNYSEDSTLEDVVKYVFDQGASELQGYSYQITGARKLGQFTIENNPNGLQVFEELKKTYKIYTYERDKVFYIGFAYSEELPEAKEINFEKQIISNNLIYKEADAVKLGVKVKSIHPETNVKTEVFVGETGGDVITLFDPSGTDNPEELREFGEKELEKFKYTGFTGDFLTFLHPYVKHSTSVNLTSSRQPERNGEYYIKRVVTEFGMEGGKQTITPDRIRV